MSAGPCWSFDRHGQALVDLPAGGQVLIAGEHEDSYDPDFYIYNDVVLRDATDRITILGYPETDFPPTDFHSATLVEREIYLIGNLGYVSARVPTHTQVLILNIDGWQIRSVNTTGELPGWIHDHKAALSGDGREIVIGGGKVCRGQRIVENLDDYALCLRSGVWRRLTQRLWRRWLLQRADGSSNDLWQLRTAAWDQHFGGAIDAHLRKSFAELPDEILEQMSFSRFSPAQLTAVERLYEFEACEQRATETDKHGEYRLTLQGTPVRFNEDFDSVTVTLEGDLPNDTIERLLQALQINLQAAEGQPYTIVDLTNEVAD